MFWRLSTVASQLEDLIFCDQIRSWRMGELRVKLKWEEKEKLKLRLTSRSSNLMYYPAPISLFWQRWLFFRLEESWQKLHVILCTILVCFGPFCSADPLQISCCFCTISLLFYETWVCWRDVSVGMMSPGENEPLPRHKCAIDCHYQNIKLWGGWHRLGQFHAFASTRHFLILHLLAISVSLCLHRWATETSVQSLASGRSSAASAPSSASSSSGCPSPSSATASPSSTRGRSVGRRTRHKAASWKGKEWTATYKQLTLTTGSHSIPNEVSDRQR